METEDHPTRHVRRSTGRDLDACVQVLAAVHERDGYPLNWPDRPGDWLTQPAPLSAWVAELDGRVAGHVRLSRGDDGDIAPGLWSARAGAGRAATAVISRLFVAPAARGHGLGALLLARAVQDATDRGLHAVLDVLTSDTAATALYERLGWTLLGTTEQRWTPRQTVTLRSYAAPLAP
ncbi:MULTISPECIES: GNAT family N-acetyltransferase [unclassified Streptomyces]|uniref:GNAT family N-acetyltransferase n=1 Tax=unclassified Streptomyces TaxID=2593676 RepID=UPI0033218DD2